MLENARRQFILVLITLVAALFCCAFLSPLWGPDLKGGNQLIYEVPEEVLQKLEAQGIKSHDVMTHTVLVVGQRIDPTGVNGALVSERGHNGILIELPWADKDTLDQIKERISSLGKLEMRVAADELYQGKDDDAGVHFDLPKEKQQLQKWLDAGGRDAVRKDWKAINTFNDDSVNGPLAKMKRNNVTLPALRWIPHLVYPSIDEDRKDRWDQVYSNDTTPHENITPLGPSTVAVFDQNTEWNQGKVPPAMIAAASKKKDPRPFLVEFVAINMSERFFKGEDLDPSKVSTGYSDEGKIAVNYQLRPEFNTDYGDWSAKYIKRHSAIILNGVIKTAPFFAGRIPGHGQISGAFTQAEADELVKVLRTGSLQVEPVLLSDRTTGPNLGTRSLWLGGFSLVAGTAAVFLFMIWYYRTAGIVACVTLLLQMLLTWAGMLFMQATITLPGLGGLVLSMGMAVDANVLIYERIREETERGKDIVRAVRAGFERAMSAILDTNITHFLSCLVLYGVGFGPVRGFAVMLMIGVVTTVFSQFFVTRLCFHWLLEHKKLVDFKVRRFFSQPKIDYFRYAKGWIIGSVVVTVGGLLFFFSTPTEISLGIDFKGGANLQMQLAKATTVQAVRGRLEHDAEFQRDFHHASIITVTPNSDGTSQTFNVRIKLTDEMRLKIEGERAKWRQEQSAATKDPEKAQAPPPYEPPYLQSLKRIFAGELARAAFDDPRVDPVPEGAAYASIKLHFEDKVDVVAAQKHLTELKGPGVKVDAQAGTDTQSADLLVQWPVAVATPTWELFRQVRDGFEQLEAVDHKPVKLSNPFPEAEEIQGRMVSELRNSAIGAVILAWGLIILFLRVRFHEYKWGIAAVVSLVHDVLVALGAVVVVNYFGLVNAEIGLDMIACFLTIIGYSVTDTIVIFDRIRENANEARKHGTRIELRPLINLSVNQTLSRTILTSGVTLFTVLAQFLVNWGQGNALESFSFGMMVGIVTGTYSSVFIAAPIVAWIHDRWGGNIAGTGGTPDGGTTGGAAVAVSLTGDGGEAAAGT